MSISLGVRGRKQDFNTMPEPNETTLNGGEPTNTNEPVVFTPEQQAAISSLVENRLNRQKTALEKAADEKLRLAIEAAVNEEREKHKPTTNHEGQTDAEKAQFKAILDGEKSLTKQEREAREKAEAKAKELEETNRKILKDVALRDAIIDQDTFRFHNIDVVKTLTEKYVSFDDETGSFVVKDDNGVVKQNSSLQPMSLKEYYAQYAAQHPYLVSSNVKGGAGSGESNRTLAGGMAKVTSKADLKDFKAKSDFINKFGGEAYEKLPLK